MKKCFSWTAVASLCVLVGQFAAPAHAASLTATLSTTSGPQGTVVAVSGTGWPGDDTLIDVIWDDGGGGPAATGPQDPDGTFSFTFAVPATEAPGVHTVTITDLAHANYGFVDLQFTVTTEAVSDCPVTFIGVHGANEGSETNWGSTNDSVWSAFHLPVKGAVPEVAPYPFTPIKFPPHNATELAQLSGQLRQLEGVANTAAAAIVNLINGHYRTCGSRTKIVISGYSLGAWATDKALRILDATTDGKKALATVRGVYLEGDPAYPYHLCGDSRKTSCRRGIATHYGRGYPEQASYLANGLGPGRFRSVCVSYDTGRDPVCGLLRTVDVLAAANRDAHYSYAKSGGAAQGGDFLATLV